MPCMNGNVEGLFSHVNSVETINMTDERLDRKLHYQRNILQPVKKEVIASASDRMKKKGCKVTRVSAYGTREDCQQIAQKLKHIIDCKCSIS